MDYDLTDLRLFVAMAEERNLTRGAARAFLAPSSASHRLRRLEDALQTPLFDRQPRGLEPTRAGEALLRHARQVFACIEQMHAELSP
ncbi:MAG: LysR family transcriptional regulator, partial [Giesbergeria sp.]